MDPNQTAPKEQSGQCTHCLPFRLYLLDALQAVSFLEQFLYYTTNLLSNATNSLLRG